MPDWSWISRELGAAGSIMGSPTSEAIVDLVQRMERFELTDAEREFVVSSFASLIRGISLPRPNEELETWKDCQPGDYSVGDTVRVRPAAYHGQHGMWHNGKRGKVIATRNNFVLVRYDGDGAEDGVNHTPEALQVLVP